MSRNFSLVVAFCVVLFGAILAGYWDMLDSEKLRLVRDQAANSVAELSGTRPGERSTSQPAGTKTAGDGTGTPAAEAPTPVARKAAAAAASSHSDAEPSAAPSSPSESSSVASALPRAATPPVASASPAVVSPRFDILRVEPDGSAVLAGRAAPNADVRLVDGARTLGTAKASPGGDFAVVLDERLPVGDHQIQIEATSGRAAAPVRSNETAIVSVPRPGDKGELLAMVEAPDKPSRIITLPAAEPTAADPAAATAGSPAAAPLGSTASRASASTAAPEGAPASSQGPVPVDAATTAAAVPSPFGVEAVEVENGKVYVAGRAPGSDPVRVYIDDKLIGEDGRRANGRFLITATVPLAVGDHRIRADMIGVGGAVASRVEVPFAKPEGEAMSAVASSDAGVATTDDPSPASNGVAAAPTTSAAAPQTVANASLPTALPTPQHEASPPAVRSTPTAVAPATAATATVPADASRTADASGVPVAKPEPAAAASAASGPAASEVVTIRQPALEGVHSRVLIRRGDTLWRISRQTYGFGRRYTVIYVANGDQIRNPNRIYPGQVFRLPEHEAPGEPTAAN